MSVLKAIQTLPLDFEGKRSVSDGLKRFLLKVLEKDPAKRYTLEQMKKDEWVNDGLQPLSGVSTTEVTAPGGVLRVGPASTKY